MQRRGGYPREKFCDQKTSEIYRCRICTDVCRSPVTCKSGAHLFCLDCLTERIFSLDCLIESKEQYSSCPVCREKLTNPLPSAFVAAQVSALDVVCVHDKCQWKGTCGRLDGHLDSDCPHEPIKCSGDGGCGALVPRGEMSEHQWCACLQRCPNVAKYRFVIVRDGNGENESLVSMLGVDNLEMCKVRMSRKDMNNHLNNDCILRMIRCPHPHCEMSVAYCRLPAHLIACPHSPESCPLHCGAPNLTRQSLGAHKNDCPNDPVPCVHAHLGCSYVAPRGQIGQHEQDIGVHFVALSKAFVVQQRQNAILESKLQAISTQFQPLALATAVERGKIKVEQLAEDAQLKEPRSKKPRPKTPKPKKRSLSGWPM